MFPIKRESEIKLNKPVLPWNKVILAGLIAMVATAMAAEPVIFIGVALAFVAWVIIVFPELGLVLTLYAGRFRQFPLAEVFPDWFYAALPLLVLTAIGTALILIKQGRVKVRGIGFPGAIAMIMLAGLSVTLAPQYGLSKTMEQLLYVVPVFIMVQVVLQEDYDRIKNLLIVVFIAAAFFGFAGLAQGLRGGGLGDARVAAFGGGPNVFARLVSMGILMVPFIFKRINNSFAKLVVLGSSILMFLAVFLSGSRGSALALFICLVLLFIFWPSDKKGIWKLVVLGVFIILCILFYIRFADILGPLLRLAINRFALLFQKNKGGSVSIRWHWIVSCFSYAQSNIAFGLGTGSFSALLTGRDEKAYPHNIFAELILENGLIGLLVFIAFLFWVVWKARCILKSVTNLSDKRMLLSLFVCFVFTVIVAQISGDLYDNRLIWFFGAVIASMSGRKEEKVSYI